MSKNFEDELFGDLNIEQELDQNSFEPKTLVDDPGFKTLSNADIEKLSKPPSRQTTSIKSALREPPAQSPVKWIVASVGLLLLGAVGSMYAIGFFDSEQASYNVKKRVAPKRLRKNKQIVFLDSVPKGASVWINGQPHTKKTPFQVILLGGRNYKFVLKSKGYKDASWKFRTQDKPVKSLKHLVKLVPIKKSNSKAPKGPDKGILNGEGWIKFTCTPKNLMVKLGIKKPVKCPPSMGIDGGTHPLEAFLEGYKPIKRIVTVNPAQVVPVVLRLRKLSARELRRYKRGQRSGKRQNARLAPTRRRKFRRARKRGKGTVTIACSTPSRVYWRGRKIGKTPLRYKFPAGRQKVTLRGPRGLRRTVRILVKARKSIKKTFSYRFGKIKFQIKPWADVWINGKKIGQTPIPPKKLKEGVYTILLKMKNKSKRKRVRVTGNQTSYLFHYFN